MNDQLFTNNHGLRLIAEFEGKPRLKARLCEGGKFELSYGVTFDLDGQPFTEDSTCTPEYADALFRNALQLFEDGVRDAVTAPLNSNQFSALVALAYNIGLANFKTSTVLRRVNEGRMDDAAASFGMWVFATKGGHKQALRGLLRRRYAEACLFMGYDWAQACDTDAIALQREAPAKLPGEDRVIYKTPFKDVLSVAQGHPLEPSPELVLDKPITTFKDMAAATNAATSQAEPTVPPTQVGNADGPEPKAPAASAQEKPGVVSPAGPERGAGVSLPPSPPVAPKVPVPPISTKPPEPDPKVIIAPKSVDVRSVPYGEIDLDKGAKNMTDSQRAIGLVVVGIGSFIQVVTMRLGIGTAVGAIFFDLSRDPAVIALIATGVVVVIGWITRKRGTKVMTKGMVSATQLLK